ncbi:hypothetical protein NP493_99g00016 [Ridgeia piscesae]|uniref:TGF-beta family profile domain-containing protein n=1 Tax=Ridgeia piscesae TaxID=27915 RepID=A0AAD9UHI0_RIDPI|nr:hypothetical protein NP493_99g00016 [Ridgeia piscesae]
MLKAELHVYRKKKKRRFAIAIKLRRLSGGRLQELGSPREISRESYGWQSRDVSGDVSACMTERRRRNLVLVATFSAKRRNGRQVALRMAKFMRHMSPPFLVVFSKDAQNITLDQIDTRRGDDGMDSSFVHPESGRAERFGGRQTVKRGADPDVDEATSDGFARSRRSIFDNEIPEDPTKRVVDPPSDYSVPRSHPSILQGRTQYRKRVSKSRLLPYPPEFERRRRRRKHNRKQRRRNRLTYGMMGPRWGNRDGAAKAFNDVSDSTDTAHLCRRRKLVVDFADIGWSEWVISPKSFEAHYCAGACPFPMAQVCTSVFRIVSILRNRPMCSFKLAHTHFIRHFSFWFPKMS